MRSPQNRQVGDDEVVKVTAEATPSAMEPIYPSMYITQRIIDYTPLKEKCQAEIFPAPCAHAGRMMSPKGKNCEEEMDDKVPSGNMQ